ncbi:hypothetical protein AQ843_09600, partial [Burkholderia pseudomallei]
ARCFGRQYRIGFRARHVRAHARRLHSGVALLGVTALLSLLILLGVRAGSGGLVTGRRRLLCLRSKRDQSSDW